MRALVVSFIKSMYPLLHRDSRALCHLAADACIVLPPYVSVSVARRGLAPFPCIVSPSHQRVEKWGRQCSTPFRAAASDKDREMDGSRVLVLDGYTRMYACIHVPYLVFVLPLWSVSARSPRMPAFPLLSPPATNVLRNEAGQTIKDHEDDNPRPATETER